MTLRIHYYGLLQSPASWARIGRELLPALDRLPVALTAASVKGFGYNQTFPLAPALQTIIDRRRTPYDIVLSFTHPATYHRHNGKKLFAIMTYEAESLPKAWVSNINTFAAALFVPSRYVHTACRTAGINIPIYTIPHGINTNIFHPKQHHSRALEHSDDYTFLFVGTSHWRKGLHILLDVWMKTFLPNDAVRLIIKTLPVSSKNNRKLKYWEIPDIPKRIDHLQTKGYSILLHTHCIDDTELADLYSGVDAIVLPAYCEGFGLAVLEAMSCAKPVITSAYGGVLDFCNDTNAFLIPAFRRIDTYGVYDAPHEQLITGYPDADSLAAAMKHCFQNRISENIHGRTTALQYTWDSAAQKIYTIISDFSSGHTQTE